MVKEIEIYAGKKMLVDFGKIKSIICDVFLIFLFFVFILLPNTNKIVGLESRNFLLIVVSFVTMIVLIGAKILSGDIKTNKYSVILFMYFICMLISCFVSDYKSNVILGTDGRGEGLIGLISYMFCFYITFNGFKLSSRIFNYMTIAVLILAGYGAVQSLLSDNYVFFTTRPYMGQSNFGNPNTFSSFLMLVLPIYLVKYYNSMEKIYLFVMSVIFAGIIGSKTFAGYITALFVLIILSGYFLFIKKDKKKILLSIANIVITFVIIFTLFNISNDNAYIGEIGENKTEIEVITSNKTESGSNSSNIQKFGNNRGYIWRLTCDIISRHPWFGVGPDSLGKEIKMNYMNRDDYIFGESWVDKAHNEYLQIAVTTGVLSLIVYIVFLFTILISLLVRYIKHVKYGRVKEEKTMILVAVTGSIVAYIVQAAANISIFAVTPLFWAMLGIGAKIATDND